MGVSEEAALSGLRIYGQDVVEGGITTNHVSGTMCRAYMHIKLHRLVYILFLDKQGHCVSGRLNDVSKVIRPKNQSTLAWR